MDSVRADGAPDGSQRGLSRWWSISTLVAFACFLALSVLVTWPLAALGSSAIVGDRMDPSQTIWGFWWWRHYGEFGPDPFHTSLLWWPDGVSLWFQSWDLPATFIATATRRWFSEVSVYNAAVFASFPLAGLTFYLLSVELWSNRLAAWCASCLYTFSTFHFAHAQMQLHVASMQWSPVFFWALIRLRKFARYSDGVMAGVALAISTLASVYYLVFCVVGAIVLISTGSRGALVSRRAVGPIGAGLATFVVMTGWLVLGMAESYRGETYVRVHDPDVFSADLESFFLPNAVSLWSTMLTRWRYWTGNSWESSSYLGYVGVAMALASCRRAHDARPFLWMAALGLVLALGPHPHVAGVVYHNLTLPQAWIENTVPPLSFSGLPVRFAWLATFGIAVAAGASLSRLCQRGILGCIVAVALTALSVAETWPRAFATTKWPSLPIFRQWAEDRSRWAVLDGTDLGQSLWNQMQHHHPIVAGYATRFPRRLLDGLSHEPALKAFLPVPFNGPPALPAEKSRSSLRGLGIRYVIVPNRQREEAVALGLQAVYRSDDLSIYAVPEG